MTDGGPVVLYRYGALAWFWRGLIGLALLGSAALAWPVAQGDFVALAVALPLLLPALFFGFVVATRVERDGPELRLRTLLGLPRRVRLDQLGVPVRRAMAQATTQRIYAPRLWQPVRRRLPFYLDLLATIPDRRAFEQVFGALPSRRG